MRQYESYKASGVKWTGNIPSHWDIRPGFTCFSENKNRNKGLVEKTVLSLSYGRLVIKPEEKLTGLVPESFEGYQLIRPGDIVIRTTDLQNDQTSLRVGFARDRGMITSAYLGLRSHPDLNPEYLFRVLESYDALKVFYGMGSGLRQNIDFSDFKRLPILVPPKKEQDRIVDFLTRKTVDIEAAIAQKEKIIKLLHEQRKLFLSHAVCGKGQGRASFSEIGAPHFGAIPSHWTLKRNKNLFYECKEIVGKNASSFKLLSLTLGGVVLRDLENPKGKFPAEFDSYKIVEPGDLIYCLFDVEETPRTVGYSPHAGMITGAYTVVRCFDKDIAEWLHYFYIAVDNSKALRSLYTGLRNVVQRDVFFGLLTPLPPEQERKQIIERIKDFMKETDKLISLVEQEKSLLQSYKISLIAESVFGKIKV